MLGERIRRARNLRGLTLDDLASLLVTITKQALSRFERGASTPNSTHLIQIATALNVKPEYFFRADIPSFAPLQFHRLTKIPKYVQRQIEPQIRAHLERYFLLEQCFDSIAITMNPISSGTFVVSDFQQAEQAAEKLRIQWEIGTDAIAHLTDLLERRGIKVAFFDGADELDSSCVTSANLEHVIIVLNRKRLGEDLRFDAAQELGLWVMKLPKEMSEKSKEMCCHRFAGAFLYPAAQVAADFGNHIRSKVHVTELLNAKRRFGISIKVVMDRLETLGLLTEAAYKSANLDLNRNGWSKAEPGSLLPEIPRRFESLVYWGMAEQLFSRSRAAEFLQCPIEEFEGTSA